MFNFCILPGEIIFQNYWSICRIYQRLYVATLAIWHYKINSGSGKSEQRTALLELNS